MRAPFGWGRSLYLGNVVYIHSCTGDLMVFKPVYSTHGARDSLSPTAAGSSVLILLAKLIIETPLSHVVRLRAYRPATFCHFQHSIIQFTMCLFVSGVNLVVNQYDTVISSV